MHASALSGDEPSAQEIVHALACTNSGCACHKAAQRGYGLTHCPVHNDSTPSFNVSYKDNIVLVHCESGICTQEEVVAALQARDLWPIHTNTVDVKQHVVAEYDYKDRNGTLVYQAVRMGPNKNFLQRRPDGAGGWIWNLNGIERVLYRLPELVAADPKRLRLIVEGEKDVDNLIRLGFVATSNVGGAGKWLPKYASFFQDSHVILIPDNDSPGRNHMRQVATYLKDVASSIRWLDLPGLEPKGDVTDWLDHGGDADQLKFLIKASPIYTDAVVNPLVTLADEYLERSLIYTCANIPAAIEYLQPDDFTNDGLRAMFRALRAKEKIDLEALVEPHEDFDEWKAISKIRDLTRRRAALKIAEHITTVATDLVRVFNPCLAADALNALCEHAHDTTDIEKLTDVLDLM